MVSKVYLNTLINLRENFSVKLITGFRGVGKLELLKMFASYLKSEGATEEQIIFMNFEEIEIFSDFQQLYLYVNKKIATADYAYLFFYGIQKIDGWEKAINAFFLGAPVEIYIADSNEKLLIDKLLPLLPDNVDILRMYPLSFSEFVQSVSIDVQLLNAVNVDVSNLLKKYSKFGGLSVVSSCLNDEKFSQHLLAGLLYETLFKDITIRYSLRNSYLFQVMLKFLAFNLGKPIKARALEEYFNDIKLSTTSFTVDNYLNIIDESGFFMKVPRYDVKNDSFINGGECYYCIDSGVCNVLLNFDNIEETALIKNIVYLELLRRGYEVYCARIGTMAADFFAVSDKNRICIQVLPTDGKVSIGRLLRPLHKLPDDVYKILISKNPEKIKKDVKNITVTDFLLNNDYS